MGGLLGMVVGVVGLVLMANGWVPCAQGVRNKGASGLCAKMIFLNFRLTRTTDISISPLRLNNRERALESRVLISYVYTRGSMSRRSSPDGRRSV